MISPRNRNACKSCLRNRVFTQRVLLRRRRCRRGDLLFNLEPARRVHHHVLSQRNSTWARNKKRTSKLDHSRSLDRERMMRERGSRAPDDDERGHSWYTQQLRYQRLSPRWVIIPVSRWKFSSYYSSVRRFSWWTLPYNANERSSVQRIDLPLGSCSEAEELVCWRSSGLLWQGVSAVAFSAAIQRVTACQTRNNTNSLAVVNTTAAWAIIECWMKSTSQENTSKHRDRGFAAADSLPAACSRRVLYPFAGITPPHRSAAKSLPIGPEPALPAGLLGGASLGPSTRPIGRESRVRTRGRIPACQLHL